MSGGRRHLWAEEKLLRVAALLLVAWPLTATAGAAGLPPFAYDRSKPLEVAWGPTVASRGIVRQELTFRASGPSRSAAFFVHPSSGASWPLVLWTPGRGGDRTEELPDALALARAGIASLLVDPPAPEVVTCDAKRDLATFIRYVIGRRRAIDLALTLPSVDGTRIAAAGFSYGSSVTAVLAGVEHRIRVLAVKSGRGHHTGFMRLACAQLDKRRLDAYVEKLAHVDPIRWLPKAASSAFLIQDGTRDPWNPHADVLALYGAVHGRKQLRFYPAGHELNAAASAYRVAWLRRELRR